jgi:hypothetical protein
MGGVLLLMGGEHFLQMGRTKLVLNESRGVNLIYMSYPIFPKPLRHKTTIPRNSPRRLPESQCPELLEH